MDVFSQKIPVRKRISYRFEGKDGRQVEKLVVVPEEITSYSLGDIAAALHSHRQAELGENIPDVNVSISRDEDTTYVYTVIKRPRLHIAAVSQNRIPLRSTGTDLDPFRKE